MSFYFKPSSSTYANATVVNNRLKEWTNHIGLALRQHFLCLNITHAMIVYDDDDDVWSSFMLSIRPGRKIMMVSYIVREVTLWHGTSQNEKNQNLHTRYCSKLETNKDLLLVSRLPCCVVCGCVQCIYCLRSFNFTLSISIVLCYFFCVFSHFSIKTQAY